MTTRIKRLSLDVLDYQEVSTGTPRRFLHVAPCRTGAERIDLWFADAAPSHEVAAGVYIAGTGHPLPAEILDDRARYLGTCVMPSQLVWHVFIGSPR